MNTHSKIPKARTCQKMYIYRCVWKISNVGWIEEYPKKSATTYISNAIMFTAHTVDIVNNVLMELG